MRAYESARSSRTRRLVAGAIVLSGIISGTAGAEPPTVVAPVTEFRSVGVYNGPQAPAQASVESVPIPGPLGTPEPSHSARPTPRQPAPKVIVVKPKPKARVHSVRGVATYYCWPAGGSRCTHGFPADGAYGAAGPELRAALGHWRGRTVYVNGVAVRLIDWCACGGAHVIDVYHSTWITIPHQNHVTITW